MLWGWFENNWDDGEKNDATRIMESERNARRRTSATFRISDEIGNEEATGLLTDESNPSRNPRTSTHHQKHMDENCQHRDCSKLLRPLSLIFAILLLVTIVVTSYLKLCQQSSSTSKLPGNFNDIEDGTSTSDQKLGLVLHPEDHVFRQPVTITHNWTVTSDFRSPDGVKKRVYLVNGRFPGPTIECRSGDRLIVQVKNNLTTEGVSIHWHGLHMRNANSMDGAVGFTQCSIPVGGTFSYDFLIDENQSGTFWWHAHSQVERGDGLYGGLVIHKPEGEKKDMMSSGYDKEVLLLIGDWYHRSAEEVLAWYTSTRGFGNEASRRSTLLPGGAPGALD